MPPLTFPENSTRGEAKLIYTEVQRRVECLKLGLSPDTPWSKVISAQLNAYNNENILWLAASTNQTRNH